jgi:hypothetical protein
MTWLVSPSVPDRHAEIGHNVSDEPDVVAALCYANRTKAIHEQTRLIAEAGGRQRPRRKRRARSTALVTANVFNANGGSIGHGRASEDQALREVQRRHVCGSLLTRQLPLIGDTNPSWRIVVRGWLLTAADRAALARHGASEIRMKPCNADVLLHASKS